MDRFMWWTPLQVHRPWLPRIFRGGDEWHNPSVAIIVPFLGAFIWFYGREFSRAGEEHVSGWSGNDLHGRVVEGCTTCDEIMDFYLSTH